MVTIYIIDKKHEKKTTIYYDISCQLINPSVATRTAVKRSQRARWSE